MRTCTLASNITCVLVFVINSVYAGDPKQIRSAILKSNEVTVILYNYGNLTRPVTLLNQADFAWRGLGYFSDFTPLLAGKVVGSAGDSVVVLSEGEFFESSGAYSLDGTLKWGWLPRGGYANPDSSKIATLKNPSSWPTNWSHWLGSEQDSEVVGQDEAFYVMDDFTNKRDPYYPFPEDTTKRGLGVSARVRVIQHGGPLNNTVLVSYVLSNESPKPLKGLYFGFYCDPHVGGAIDYSDDMGSFVSSDGLAAFPELSKAANTILCWDSDANGAGGLVPGYLGFKFVETPGNLELTSFHLAPYTNSLPNVPKNKTLMWNWLSGGFKDPGMFATSPGDYIVVAGTGPFDLDSSQSKEILIAAFLSESRDRFLQEAGAMPYFVHWPSLSSLEWAHGGDSTFSITLEDQTLLSGVSQVRWVHSGSAKRAKVYLQYSSDFGEHWNTLATAIPADEPYYWNTQKLENGADYMLRAIAYDSTDLSKYWFWVSERFTVSNTTKVESVQGFPLSISISQNFPNPFNPTTTFSYELSAVSEVRLAIFDVLGREIVVLVDGKEQAGTHKKNWDASIFPSGMYFYRFQAGSHVETKRLVLLK